MSRQGARRTAPDLVVLLAAVLPGHVHQDGCRALGKPFHHPLSELGIS